MLRRDRHANALAKQLLKPRIVQRTSLWGTSYQSELKPAIAFAVENGFVAPIPQDTLHRLEPLLPHGFTTADAVDKARTAVTTLQAQREGAIATINLEELHLSYCKVIAPFSGRVINLNISAGAHVTAGAPVFSLLDTSKWYVIANFREAEIRHMAPGSEAIVYLSSAPNQRFRGKVQGIGWAVKPEGEIDLPASGVPYVKRELNWVRVAQRFPVRIEVENPDPNLFRMGASAVAIIDGPPR